MRGDRVDHVRVLRLVEEPVDEPHRVEAEVAADRRRSSTPGAHQQLRRVERARSGDDRAGVGRAALAGGVDVLDPGRLAAVDQHALDRRVRAAARAARAPSASWMYVFIVDLPAFVGQPCRQEPQRMQFASV